MRIGEFTVSDYRSINGAKDIKMNTYTSLVGKNNEGKSNLLRALNLAILGMKRIVEADLKKGEKGTWRLASIYRRWSFQEDRVTYDYDTDYPKNKEITTDTNTTVTISFHLTDEEVYQFKNELRIQTNNTLQLRFVYTDGELEIKVIKRGAKNWDDKIDSILKFITNKINFTYIPAVRTEDTFGKIIDMELQNVLYEAAKSSEYNKLLDEMKRMEQEAVDQVTKMLKSDLSEWLPSVEEVRLDVSSNHAYLSPNLRFKSTDLYVESGGTETSLATKGDGIKSLFAIALMAKQKNSKINNILAIDEPEAHLHPEAIHRLQKTIQGLSESGQVIVATHNPIFVNKQDVSNNIIVDSGTVNKANDIKEIRDILGVEIEDNLMNTSNIVYVEGPTDKVFFSKFIQIYGSDRLKNELKYGRIRIEDLGGINHARQRMYAANQQMLNTYLIVDKDDAGDTEIQYLLNHDLITQQNYVKLPIPVGMKQASLELENFYKEDYLANICAEYMNVSLNVIHSAIMNRQRNAKWSEQMEVICRQVSKQFDSDMETELKNRLVDSVSADNLSEHGVLAVKEIIAGIDRYFFRV